MTKSTVSQEQHPALSTVLSFIEALHAEKWSEAAACLQEDFAFQGVLGSRDGAAAYMQDMERMKIKYQVEKTITEGNDVCVICEYLISGVTLVGCNWYHLEGGQIASLRAIFDPRLLLKDAS